mmetsp:Transcript_159375/g.511316  ORF Transcript_159375/g.511316 Transcript_159375/m.511316 type:complete len:215 (+) Transcript_159375:2799-3443(+)
MPRLAAQTAVPQQLLWMAPSTPSPSASAARSADQCMHSPWATRRRTSIPSAWPGPWQRAPWFRTGGAALPEALKVAAPIRWSLAYLRSQTRATWGSEAELPQHPSPRASPPSQAAPRPPRASPGGSAASAPPAPRRRRRLRRRGRPSAAAARRAPPRRPARGPPRAAGPAQRKTTRVQPRGPPRSLQQSPPPMRRNPAGPREGSLPLRPPRAAR